jgi:steroid delta-isomerase-like uncharacterized protein
MTAEEQELEALYRRYNATCNDHRFHQLDAFVAADVRVNDEEQGLPQYVRGLEAVVAAFPDYRWDIQHLFVRERAVSAHFVDTGTHRGAFLGVPATGRRVRTREFAVYHVRDARITDVWVTADNLLLLDQLR